MERLRAPAGSVTSGRVGLGLAVDDNFFNAQQRGHAVQLDGPGFRRDHSAARGEQQGIADFPGDRLAAVPDGAAPDALRRAEQVKFAAVDFAVGDREEFLFWRPHDALRRPDPEIFEVVRDTSDTRSSSSSRRPFGLNQCPLEKRMRPLRFVPIQRLPSRSGWIERTVRSGISAPPSVRDRIAAF